MYIVISQHDVHKIEQDLAFGTTYLEEVLEYLGRPTHIFPKQPRNPFGEMVYKITFCDNPTLTKVAEHIDSSD